MITKQQFTKMGIMRRRVALAKDVLAQLAAQMLFSRRGSYVEIASGSEEISFDERFDKAFFQKYLNRNKCYVCAKGALICAYVDKYNSITLSEAQHGMENKKLKRMVGTNFWNCLEILFEFWIPNDAIVKVY